MKEQPRCQETHYGDCAYRPDMHGILIPGKRGRLLSVLYTAAGEGVHPTVLLLHGIPGCERNLDLAQALRRAGFHVMTFHYSGSWGSDGNYSLSNDLEDANTVLDFILRDDSYGFDKQHIYAVGHSMGGFVCGQIAGHRSEIKGAVLLTPCDIGRLPQIAQEDPASYQTVQEVLDESAQWLTGTSGEALLREALDNSETFRLENAAEALAQKPILCIGGTLDIYTPPTLHCEPLIRAIQAAGGTSLQTVSYPTDHFFADYRITMAETVTEFLKKQLSE
jgi:pimeloyl-ACP methyl ester carboxylesterase